MTVPHLMNCAHSDDGWCLTCVAQLGNENWRLQERLTAAAQPLPAPLPSVPAETFLSQVAECRAAVAQWPQAMVKATTPVDANAPQLMPAAPAAQGEPKPPGQGETP